MRGLYVFEFASALFLSFAHSIPHAPHAPKCPPFSGDFSIDIEDLFPESADWDPVHCKLYAGANYNATFVIYDPYDKSYEVVAIPGISGNLDYAVTGVDYDANTGSMFLAATSSTCFDSTITGNASYANFTGLNAIIKYNTFAREIDFVTSFVPIQNEIKEQTGSLVTGIQDMAEDTKGNSYAIATFGHLIVKVDALGQASIFYQGSNLTDALGFEGIFSVEDKIVVSDRAVAGFLTFDTTEPVTNPIVVKPKNLPSPAPGWDGMIIPSRYGGKIAVVADDLHGTRVYGSADKWVTAEYLGGIPQSPAVGSADPTKFVATTDTFEIAQSVYSSTDYFSIPRAENYYGEVTKMSSFPIVDITEATDKLYKGWNCSDNI